MRNVKYKFTYVLGTVVVAMLLSSASTNSPLELRFVAIDGRQIDLATMRGKVVLIDCWTTWCGPCLKEMPHIKDLYDRYHNRGFEVIGISMDEAAAKDRVKRIMLNMNIPWPQRFEGKGFDEDSFKKQYGIKSLPTLYFLDREGNIVDMNARGEHLEVLIKQYLEI